MELVILGRFCLLRAKIKVRVYDIVATIFHSFFQLLLPFQAQFLQLCLNLGMLPAMEIQFTFTEGCLLASLSPTPVYGLPQANSSYKAQGKNQDDAESCKLGGLFRSICTKVDFQLYSLRINRCTRRNLNQNVSLPY